MNSLITFRKILVETFGELELKTLNIRRMNIRYWIIFYVGELNCKLLQSYLIYEFTHRSPLLHGGSATSDVKVLPNMLFS